MVVRSARLVASYVVPHRARMRRSAARVDRLVRVATGCRVATGPFEGMILDRASWGHLSPYLMGSYECAAVAALEELMSAAPRRVIDVGAAEGYYAVGLAIRLPDAEIHAFDTDPWSRRLCRRTALRNGVTKRVHVRDACTHGDLERLAGRDALLIVDCEGCETHLLNPVAAPRLRETPMIVELHDFLDPSISQRLRETFAPTHTIRIIPAEERDPGAWCGSVGLSPEARKAAVSEWRPTSPPMAWAVLSPVTAERAPTRS